MGYTVLKKRNLYNWLKFILSVPLIVIIAIFVTAVNFYGIEWIVGAILFCALLWVYRVSYSFSDAEVMVGYSFNLLGFYYLSVKLNGSKVKKVTREKIIKFKVSEKKEFILDSTQLHKTGPKFKLE
ncbi:hypothetical protein MKZ42_15510 [Pseudoalteromonas shioyasakiensis]|uniref:Uncharacterized protein n=1 Tax=Pseudoalteromonas shioyasakiensis TaxID=1190813 RepID=A0ABT6U3E9_9GAMM|nr:MULTISPECIES: hypothetical protein [Pseudoalteromonas]MDI4669755.1 hypothetical protein [Pseudoalteromonas shioyasakiensis]MDI4674660.1 hypothetical protein [Pseudoalteromonas shioyasakiensis]MDI4686670.1 hypothetical protein [Pseudoalteromonas shioyasakiensis]MDI4705265.1 hypothetical protein [Pseudoalteromonas shioyasakiensis]NUJ21718.1 hypothetical protein [Pseudoalteromonas sp. 0802]